LIFVGTTAVPGAEWIIQLAMGKRLRIMGTSFGARLARREATATRLSRSTSCRYSPAAAVRPVIDKVFKMEEVRAAHERN